MLVGIIDLNFTSWLVEQFCSACNAKKSWHKNPVSHVVNLVNSSRVDKSTLLSNNILLGVVNIKDHGVTY